MIFPLSGQKPWGLQFCARSQDSRFRDVSGASGAYPGATVWGLLHGSTWPEIRIPRVSRLVRSSCFSMVFHGFSPLSLLESFMDLCGKGASMDAKFPANGSLFNLRFGPIANLVPDCSTPTSLAPHASSCPNFAG